MRNETGFVDYKTTLFTKFNLFNLVQDLNMNMAEKQTHIPPVTPQNYIKLKILTRKEVSIKR